MFKLILATIKLAIVIATREIQMKLQDYNHNRKMDRIHKHFKLGKYSKA